ncbi:hypothetical protein [Bosea sp. BK604]|uniref:hypothetical protein n=1 Tax=Bosea sp. BK604 TaxID=2512180 RepID=UPI00105080F9|nr:hypothetical protein [Bosea sp. BK604]TCR65677.1 hypothetical protein EV560_105440 [Bosea sp. BK604]
MSAARAFRIASAGERQAAAERLAVLAGRTHREAACERAALRCAIEAYDRLETQPVPTSGFPSCEGRLSEAVDGTHQIVFVFSNGRWRSSDVS